MADPRLTVVLLDDDSPGSEALARTVESLRSQTSTEFEVVLVTSYPARGVRLERRTLVPCAASDSTVDRFRLGLGNARGRYVGVLEPGEVLAPEAVQTFVAVVRDDPAVDLVYADERHLGREVTKPAWSPERLRHQNYVGRPWLARTSIVRERCVDVAAAPAWEHDLLLAVCESVTSVVAVPQTLATRTRRAHVTHQGSIPAVQRHLDRVGTAASAQPGPRASIVHVARALPPDTRISVVIPTGWGRMKPLVASPDIAGLPEPGGDPMVINAVEQLLARTRHRKLEIVVVYDEPVPKGALERLTDIAGDRLRAVPYAKEFNFSEKCNVGALAATGDVLVFYNDDIVPITDEWLAALVAPLVEVGIGATGPKLRFADRSVQSGGHVYRRSPDKPEPEDSFRGRPADTVGPGDALLVDREVSGVTGACLAISRSLYLAVGGMDEEFPHAYNDVDLCLKVRQLGHRILWLASCEMVHLESQSRVPTVQPWEHAALRRRWGGFSRDAYLPSVRVD